MNNNYAKAYKEIIEIIRFFPEDEYNKIPKEKIEYYKENMDNTYKFAINPNIDLAEQNISKEANAIIISLYRDYFSTENQKEKIDNILKSNQITKEQEKKVQYNPDNLFAKSPKNSHNTIKRTDTNEQETALIEYKENFFTRFKDFILKLLHIMN